MNLKDIYNEGRKLYHENFTLLNYNELKNIVPIYDRYNAPLTDLYLLDKYGHVGISADIDALDYQRHVLGYILTNRDSILHLYNALNVDYDLFENYNIETTVTNIHGKQTETTLNNTISTLTETNDTTSTKDKTINTVSHGQSTDTETNDSFVDETTIQTNGYDSGVAPDSITTMTHKNTDGGDVKKMYVNGASTDTTTVSGTGDGDKIVDILDNDKTQNSTVTNNGNVSRETYTDTTTTSSRGNSGVSTTSQALIKQELDLWNDMAFYEILLKMILNNTSSGVWEW